MKKSKNYEEVSFKPEVLREASRVFERFIEGKEVSSSFSVTNADETWEHDSEEEFFSAYREGCKTAFYRKSADEYSLVMLKLENSTKVDVSAPGTPVLAAVFDVFEKHLEESRLPKPKGGPEEPAPMSEFTLEKRITSCLVTKDLLRQLEVYLVQYIAKIIDIPPDMLRESLSISISDSLGTETLKSISNYLPSLFPKSITEVRIDLYLVHPKHISVSIHFGKDKTSSQISIRYKAKQAREVVMAIDGGLRQIFEPSTNANNIFHPPEAAMLMIWFLGMLVGPVSMFAFAKGAFSIGVIGTVTVLTLIFYTFVGPVIKPYITFDTQRYAAMKRWSDWIIRGFIGFLIFGTLLTLLRRQIFGF